MTPEEPTNNTRDEEDLELGLGDNTSDQPVGSTSQPVARTEGEALAPNPFDLDSLALSQDYVANIGVEKELNWVSVRKPSKEWFIRVCPSEEYRKNVLLLELKDEPSREIYIVAPSLVPNLTEDVLTLCGPKTLVTCINRQKLVFIWPLRIQTSDDRGREWTTTAQLAAKSAETQWVKVVANMQAQCYETFRPRATIPDPEWPSISFSKLVEMGFRGKIIDSLNHPIVEQIQGM